jgi:hypothetical protein
MIYLKTNPEGIDRALQPYQKRLYDTLPTLWGINEDDYLSYGRCYRNQKGDGFIPEMYIGTKEYKDLYHDDTIAVQSFFGSERRDIENYVITGNCHLIFIVDLKKIKPSITHRADEEAMQEAYKVFIQDDIGLNVFRESVGIANVFAEYTGVRNSIKYRDLQNFFCFRFDFTIKYTEPFCKFPFNP